MCALWLLCHLNGPCFALDSLQEEGPVLVSPRDEVVSYSYPQKVVSGTPSCMSHFLFVVALWRGDHSAWTVSICGDPSQPLAAENTIPCKYKQNRRCLAGRGNTKLVFSSQFSDIVWIVSAFTARIYKMYLM